MGEVGGWFDFPKKVGFLSRALNKMKRRVKKGEKFWKTEGRGSTELKKIWLVYRRKWSGKEGGYE